MNIDWSDVRRMDDATRLLLPWPPTAAALFDRSRNRKSPEPTPAFRRWLVNAGTSVNAQHPLCYDEPVAVQVELCVAARERRFDFGDRCPAIRELLVIQAIVPDMAAIELIDVLREGNGPDCAVTIVPMRCIGLSRSAAE
jgi:hypothetical protein